MSMNEVAYYDCVPGLHCDDEHMLPDYCPYCRIAHLESLCREVVDAYDHDTAYPTCSNIHAAIDKLRKEGKQDG